MARFIDKAVFIGLLGAYLLFAYLCGYQKADTELSKNWYEGPEGYCLADKPPHPGDCHDANR